MPSHILKRKRTNGTTGYQVRIPVSKDADGNQKFVIRTFDKRADALEFKNEVLHDRDQGLALVPPKVTLADYLDLWLEADKRHRVKPNTFESYEATLKRYVCPFLGHRLLGELNTRAIQIWMKQLLDKGLSPRTVRYSFGLISDALGYAVRVGDLRRNVAKNVIPPKQVRKEMKALDADQVKTFLGSIKGEKHEVLFNFLVYTGLRPSEAFGLVWSDLDLDQGRVMVRRSLSWTSDGWSLGSTKTRASERSIPISGWMVSLLIEHRRQQSEVRMSIADVWKDNGFVFADEIGGPLRRANVLRRHLRPALRRADLPDDLRLYDLRHTCATLMLSKNVNPKIASERLGHASIRLTLDTYQHLMPTMQEQASDQLDEILGDTTST